jgi:hypothetical protein
VKRTEIEREFPKKSRDASLDPQEISLQEIDLQEEVRRRAYQIYEERGGLNGSALQDWLQAEAEVRESPRIRKAA